MKNNVISFEKELIPDDLIVISSYAKKYGTSKSFIYKLIAKGKIKRHKYGYFKISEKEANKVIKELNKVS